MGPHMYVVIKPQEMFVHQVLNPVIVLELFAPAPPPWLEPGMLAAPAPAPGLLAC